MDQTIAIITPAFGAETTIASTVQSVLSQTYPHWQLWLIADDGQDYEALLASAGLVDPRLRFLSSGGIGRGASVARNVALDAIATPCAAVLDADDRFKPQKLERAVAALAHHPIVSTALDVMTETFDHLRYIGQGPDRVLGPSSHKWVNLSMDSMIAWDRRRADGRYDQAMSNMTDLEFLLQLYRTGARSFHLGEPLHDYIKRSASMSNGTNVAAGMIASKTTLLQRLTSNYYHGLSAEGAEGIAGFLHISLEAESRYEAALAAKPGLLFEDHLEPMVATELTHRLGAS